MTTYPCIIFKEQLEGEIEPKDVGYMKGSSYSLKVFGENGVVTRNFTTDSNAFIDGDVIVNNRIDIVSNNGSCYSKDNDILESTGISYVLPFPTSNANIQTDMSKIRITGNLRIDHMVKTDTDYRLTEIPVSLVCDEGFNIAEVGSLTEQPYSSNTNAGAISFISAHQTVKKFNNVPVVKHTRRTERTETLGTTRKAEQIKNEDCTNVGASINMDGISNITVRQGKLCLCSGKYVQNDSTFKVSDVDLSLLDGTLVTKGLVCENLICSRISLSDDNQEGPSILMQDDMFTLMHGDTYIQNNQTGINIVGNLVIDPIVTEFGPVTKIELNGKWNTHIGGSVLLNRK